MCEPSHSIVQYPTQHPETDEPVVHLIKAAFETKINVRHEREPLIIPQGIMIGSFINYSSLGKGHSEAMGRVPWHVRNKLPLDIKYEVNWWDRRTKLDGFCEPLIYADSLESASIYAERASIGDLKILRRFLETSLKRTSSHRLYVDGILKLLSAKGREELYSTIKRVFGFKSFDFDKTMVSMLGDQKSRDKLIGMILKMTRRRQYLQDAWADDKVLWIPKQELITL